MITYRKGFPSPYSLLFRMHGAAWVRTLLPAFTAALLTVLLNIFAGDGSDVPGIRAGGGWRHPYTYQTFAFIVGFSVVFRNSSAYQRYNQARTDIQTVAGKLVESAVQICAFDLVTEDGSQAREKSKDFRRAFIHLLSLMHALMCQYLRSDWNLENICTHVPGKHPVQDSHKLPQVKKHFFSGKHQSTAHSSRPVFPRLPPLPGLRLTARPPDWRPSFVSAPLAGSYWSTIMCLQTTQSAQEIYNNLTPLLVVGGLDAEEKKALYPLMDGGDLYVGHLAPAAVRVETCYAWLHRLLLARWKVGGLAVPPPVLSRTYQVLNDSLNAFNHCR